MNENWETEYFFYAWLFDLFERVDYERQMFIRGYLEAFEENNGRISENPEKADQIVRRFDKYDTLQDALNAREDKS